MGKNGSWPKKMEDDLKKFIERRPIKIKIKGKTNSKKNGGRPHKK